MEWLGAGLRLGVWCFLLVCCGVDALSLGLRFPSRNRRGECTGQALKEITKNSAWGYHMGAIPGGSIPWWWVGGSESRIAITFAWSFLDIVKI